MSEGVNHGLKRAHGGGNGGRLHFTTMSRAEVNCYTRVELERCEDCGGLFCREVASGAMQCARCVSAKQQRDKRELAERERFRPVGDPKKMMPQ